jgi:hypothetical protein
MKKDQLPQSRPTLPDGDTRKLLHYKARVVNSLFLKLRVQMTEENRSPVSGGNALRMRSNPMSHFSQFLTINMQYSPLAFGISIPEDTILHSQRRENLKSYINYTVHCILLQN